MEKSFLVITEEPKFEYSRVIPSFRTRFAGKCDRQSRDLTQFTYHTKSSCSNSYLRKLRSEIFKQ